MADAAEILKRLIGEVEAGRRAALCAIVATRGSTPQAAGAILCVDQAARITGTLGGGCVEADVRRQAHQMLSGRQGQVLAFTLDHDFGDQDGLICGGQMDVAVGVLSTPDELEPIREAVGRLGEGLAAVLPVRVQTGDGPQEYRIGLEAPPELLIAGGGHIGRVMARLAVPLGFRVTVIDDRAAYANQDRFPPPVRAIVGDIGATLAGWPIGANTYIVIVTRGHNHDQQALIAVLASPAVYIGMIGSRRKIEVVFNDLRHAGATKEQLSRVHAPIGLKIDAVTTEEIGLSIAAELVAVRRAERHALVQGPIPVAPSEPGAPATGPPHGSPIPSPQPPGPPGERHPAPVPIRIGAVVPAAGMSRRMGPAKQVLPYLATTVTATVTQTLLDAGVDALAVVTRSELAEGLRLPADARVRTVINDDSQSEMIDSIRMGLEALGAAGMLGAKDGVVVVPGDMPEVSAETCRRCMEVFQAEPERLVIATHEERRGHPIVIPFSMGSELEGLEDGLRGLARRFPERVRLVAVSDTAVTQDMDTPEAYRRMRQRNPDRDPKPTDSNSWA